MGTSFWRNYDVIASCVGWDGPHVPPSVATSVKWLQNALDEANFNEIGIVLEPFYDIYCKWIKLTRSKHIVQSYTLSSNNAITLQWNTSITNFGSGKGLAPTGDTPLSELMLVQFIASYIYFTRPQ